MLFFNKPHVSVSFTCKDFTSYPLLFSMIILLLSLLHAGLKNIISKLWKYESDTLSIFINNMRSEHVHVQETSLV